MKEIKTFRPGDKIPSDAKFLSSHISKLNGVCVALYEVPIKTERKTADADSRKDFEKICKAIISYLNDKAGKNFKDTSKKTRDLIRARRNEGFVYVDFCTVIDKKCAEWLTDPRWNQYLRPETLFGTKFESYLNATTAQEMTQSAFDELDAHLKGDQ